MNLSFLRCAMKDSFWFSWLGCLIVKEIQSEERLDKFEMVSSEWRHLFITVEYLASFWTRFRLSREVCGFLYHTTIRILNIFDMLLTHS